MFNPISFGTVKFQFKYPGGKEFHHSDDNMSAERERHQRLLPSQEYAKNSNSKLGISAPRENKRHSYNMSVTITEPEGSFIVGAAGPLGDKLHSQAAEIAYAQAMMSRPYADTYIESATVTTEIPITRKA